MADNSAGKMEAYGGRLPHQVTSKKTAQKPTPVSDLEPSVKTSVQPLCWDA